nr:hypothetical protein [Tanacetum cinerariifolium]
MDDYLQGELEAMVGEQMVVPTIEEVVAPVAEAEEEQVITPMADMEEGQMDVSMIEMEEDLAVLFGEDDDFANDDFENDSEGVDEKEAWEVNEEWLMAPVTPPPVPAEQPPSVYKVGGPSTAVTEEPSSPHLASRLIVPPFMIEDLSTRLGNLEYEHGQLVQRVNDPYICYSNTSPDSVFRCETHFWGGVTQGGGLSICYLFG